MLYFTKKQYALPAGKSEAQVREELKSNPLFFVQAGDELMLRRGRSLPSRGITRLLIPRVVSKMSNDGQLTFSFGLDSLASLMLVLLIGAAIIDLVLSRQVYPREYPPAFIPALMLIYLAAIVYDFFMTSQTIQQTITKK